MSTHGRTSPDHSLGELVSGVTSNVSSLVRLELELAKTELQTQVRQGVVGGGLTVVAVVLALFAVVLLSVAAAFGIATVLPVWAGFLIVGGVYLLLTVIVLLAGVGRLKRVKGPKRTQASIAATKAELAERSVLRAEAKMAGLTVEQLTEREQMAITQTAAREAARTSGN